MRAGSIRGLKSLNLLAIAKGLSQILAVKIHLSAEKTV